MCNMVWLMLWCRAMSGVKCDAMWNHGVVHEECGVLWCKMWNMAVEPILSDVEWFDAILDMVWCEMIVEIQCGMCAVGCVLWDSVMCHIWMWCAWCGARWNGRDVEWCAEMWWNDLMWIMVRCEMWCDVECCIFRPGVMWNAKYAMSNMAWCGLWCLVMWNVT